MKKINLDLQDKYFQEIKEGIKDWEFRKDKEKIRSINAGDVLVLKNLTTGELMERKVWKKIKLTTETLDLLSIEYIINKSTLKFLKEYLKGEEFFWALWVWEI